MGCLSNRGVVISRDPARLEITVIDTDLRPMTLGELLDRTFKIYRNNFWLFIGIAALPGLVLLFVNTALAALQSGVVTNVSSGNGVPSLALLAGTVLGGIILLLAYVFLTGASEAATVFVVSDLYLMKSTSIGSAYRRVGRKAFRVVAITALVGIAVGVGFIFFIIPGVILLCRASVSVPVGMLEDTWPVASIQRSMELTKGYTGQIFLIFLLVTVLNLILAGICEAPFALLTQEAARNHETLSFGMQVLENVGSFIAQVLVTPITTIAFCLMYYNLRVRKEAFDLQQLLSSLDPIAPADPSATR
jgi:hypothetical protein